MSSPSPAPSAASRNSTTRSRRPAAPTTLVPLDLRDGDGIDRLGKAIFERWGHLDGLVGNAGIAGTLTPVPHIEPKEFDTALATNVTANYRLIRSRRPAAAAVRGRPRAVHHLRDRAGRRALLRHLHRNEDGARGAGQGLRRRDGADPRPHQRHEPGAAPHADARQGDPRRRPDDPAAAVGGRPRHPADAVGRLCTRPACSSISKPARRGR